MPYQVLALKYRPQVFDDVVGQGHVTTTLVNAIQRNRLAHAILFTGPRGTGKTTIARILAKAMNCETGPTPHPCNQCRTCREIVNSHCADVFEIDGASNNSVEQVRELRENVTYLPSSAPYKIYIIDEVHMLSTAAFNALLKTLEEPPDHVLFIFATTEVHKIPATILSRCQRHDLGRIPMEQLIRRLSSICEQEGVTMEGDGIDLLALAADGSVRDGLSLLDRIISSAPEARITPEMVMDGLGMFDRRLMMELSAAVLEKNTHALITLIDTVNNTGLSLKQFYGDIINHFRHLNIITLCGPDHPAVHMTASEKRQLVPMVSSLPDGYPGRLLQVLLDEEAMVKSSSHTQTAIETVLLKLCQIRPGADIEMIIRKLDHLARQTRSIPPAPRAGSPPDPGPAPPGAYHEPPSTSTAPAVSEERSAPPIRQSTPSRPSSDVPDAGDVPPTASGPALSGGETWQSFLDRMGREIPFLAALFSRSHITQSNDDELTLHLTHCKDMEKKRLDKKMPEIKAACRAVFNKDLAIHVASKSAARPRDNADLSLKKARQSAYSHPLVQEAQTIFNGRIVNL